MSKHPPKKPARPRPPAPRRPKKPTVAFELEFCDEPGLGLRTLARLLHERRLIDERRAKEQSP